MNRIYNKINNDKDLNNIFSEYSYKKKLTAGEHLFFQDCNSLGFIIVESGGLELYSTTEDGSDHTIDLLVKNRTISPETALRDDSIYDFSCKASCESNLRIIPAKIMFNAIQNNVVLNMFFLDCILDHNKILNQHKDILQHSDVEHRIGWFFLNHLTEFFKNKEIPFKNYAIASFLGIRKETFSRTIKTMQNKGIIFKHHMIATENPDSLCQYCVPSIKQKCTSKETCPDTH